MLDSLLHRHKPDILDCIANLSNDEVFTPPAVANKMLDLMPPEVWTNPELRFLDPGCKSGVFLREAAKRLMQGLEAAIPDEAARREHIFKSMLYGIAITELTAQISRRTLYYSKDASSEQSVVQLPTADGNIRYQNIAHTFKAGSCVHCGAPEGAARDLEALESHAYLFIHEELDPTMKFDVIIGNPPYQLKDGGHGASASPIYQKFVLQALAANPQYISMIIPARWFAGGKGLDEFRAQMLADRRMKVLVDHYDARDCFPGVEIKGGVCYFLWDSEHGKDSTDACVVKNVSQGEIDEAVRRLDDQDVFVRFNKAVSILEKVRAEEEPTLDQHISSRKPFGFPTNFEDYSLKSFKGAVQLVARGEQGWVAREKIEVNAAAVDTWKVYTPAAGPGNEGYPHRVTGVPFTGAPGTCCTETYLTCGPFSTSTEADHMVGYMKTRFFRFLVALRKSAQHLSKDRFAYVPALDMTQSWDDGKLQVRYGLTADEVAYIESMIKEMA